MNFINFVNENGKEELKMMCTPYIYANVIECSLHYIIYEKGKPKVIKKENQKYYLEGE